MSEQSITCPHCGKKIALTEALTHPIEEKLRQELAGQKAAIEKQALEKARSGLDRELKDLKAQLEEKSRGLDEARTQELALRKKQRELEDRERTLALELERKLDEERGRIRADAMTKAAEEHHLKDREKDKQLEDMRAQIEELKRKAEQGSQQAQGEALELELEDLLREHFKFDTVEPVAKGVRGADVLQRVVSGAGQPCGSILWESKRTKAWSEGWLQKLKDDQREAKADMCVIVSAVLPKGVSHVGRVEGVWVSDFASAAGLGTALRAGLLQLAHAQNALAGKGEKMDLIYRYLSGPEFRHRIEAIVEAFAAMREDLDSEKRSTERAWAKREKQIERVLHSTSGMYGDLQGLIGTSLASIPALEMSSEKGPSQDSGS